MSVTTTAMEAGGGHGAHRLPSSSIGITKRYGRVVACDDVDLRSTRGRIHGILGENGAGKSTLMKVLIGLVLPDAGQITLARRSECGSTIRSDGRRPRHRHGPPALQPRRGADRVGERRCSATSAASTARRARERVAEISEHYGLDIDPDARIGDLSAGMRQRVEIIKCLRRDPAILVFDEPTSVLTPAESEQLFAALRRGRRPTSARRSRSSATSSPRSCTPTDEITIMRDGRVVDQRPTAGRLGRRVARAMVGREVSLRTERGCARSDHA